jgi:hypothetical protein
MHLKENHDSHESLDLTFKICDHPFSETLVFETTMQNLIGTI